MGEQFAALIAGKHTDMDTINGMLLFAILIVAAFFFAILCIGEGEKEDSGKYFGKYRKAPPFILVAILVLYFASTHFVDASNGLLAVHAVAGVLVAVIGLPITFYMAYSKNCESWRRDETPNQGAFMTGATTTVVLLAGALLLNVIAGVVADAVKRESQWGKTISVQVDADGRKVENTAPKTEISSITITTNETTGTMWYDGITWTEKDGNGNLVVRRSMLGDGDQRTLIKYDLNEGETPYVEYFKDYKGKSAALDKGAPLCISNSEYAWTLDKAVPRCEKDSEYVEGTVKSGNKRYSVIHIPRGANDTLITMRSSGRERR